MVVMDTLSCHLGRPYQWISVVASDWLRWSTCIMSVEWARAATIATLLPPIGFRDGCSANQIPDPSSALVFIGHTVARRPQASGDVIFLRSTKKKDWCCSNGHSQYCVKFHCHGDQVPLTSLHKTAVDLVKTQLVHRVWLV